MDIKLRARLSAYSKVESITSASNSSASIPDPDILSAGHVLGVNNSGKYTLFPSIESSDIDTLFEDTSTDETITKEEIDTLFPDEKPKSVTKCEIDSLFDDDVKVEVADKDDIDTLFSDNTTISTVSHAEIDSLFNWWEGATICLILHIMAL